VTTSLVTGEAVALDVRTAGLASRLLAALIDGIAQFVALLLLSLLIGAFGGSGSAASNAALGILALVTAGLIYPVLFETLMRGRTPGKAAMGLRVVRDDAGPITFRQAFVRGLIGFVIERPGIFLGSPAVISSVISERGKRLGDLAAGTIVIQERVQASRPVLISMPPPLASWASTLDLSRLPDDLALSVRTFLTRSPSMTNAARAELGGRLASAVSSFVTPAAPAGTPEWAFLAAVLAERRRRAEAAQPAPVASAWNTVPSYGVPASSAPAAAPPTAAPPADPRPPAPPAPPSEGGFALPF
jgi:uncharacterized RDD family membrane protein YckC